jgi:hypothetical protein
MSTTLLKFGSEKKRVERSDQCLMMDKKPNILGASAGKYISYRPQQEKLEPEVFTKGLFSCKIYFQYDNTKPHISKIVT